MRNKPFVAPPLTDPAHWQRFAQMLSRSLGIDQAIIQQLEAFWNSDRLLTMLELKLKSEDATFEFMFDPDMKIFFAAEYGGDNLREALTSLEQNWGSDLDNPNDEPASPPSEKAGKR